MTVESRFRVGDVVRLASGSPAMTVCDVQPNVIQTCWFYDGTPHTGEFQPAVLNSNSDRISSAATPTRG